MKERHNRGESARSKEYSALAVEASDTIKNQFPEAVEGKFWQNREYVTNDQYLISLGYAGVEDESVLLIEHINENRSQEIHYVFKGTDVIKIGTLTVHKKNKTETVSYTDDEKDMEIREKTNRGIEFRPSLIVNIEELRLVAQIVKDPVANSELVHKLPPLPRL